MLVKVKSDNGGPVMVPYITKDSVTNSPSMVMLLDGWNEIPEDIWPLVEATMEHGISTGKFDIKCKTIEEEYEVKGEDDKPVKKTREVRIQQPLQDVRADIARQIVKECYNPITLQAWAKDIKLSAELRALVDMCLQEIDKLGE